MKYLIGFIFGVVITAVAYQSELGQSFEIDQEPADIIDTVSDQISGKVEEIDYTFYENLYQSSVTVIKDAYEAPLKTQAASEKADQALLYYVQIGAFSTLENAQGFRAQAILEGYLSGDIFVDSGDGVHRVMMGPFAEQAEAALAVEWASSRNFSGLMIAKSS